VSDVRPLTNAWGVLLALTVAFVMLAGFLIAGAWELPLRLESEMLDLRFRLRPPHSPRVPIVIVEIDDPSIAEIGRWPWSRQVLARLLDRINVAGPRVICLDLLFTEPQPSALDAQMGAVEAAMAPLLQMLNPAEKRRFEEILSELPRASDPDMSLGRAIRQDGPVIVPFALDLRPNGTTQTAPAPLPPALAKAAYNRVRGAGPDYLPEAIGLRLPVEPLSGDGLLAHVTTVPDDAGTYRYDYPVLRYGDAYLPSLSLEAVRVFLGVLKTEVVVDLGQGIDVGPLHVPTDRGMRLLVNYYPSSVFERVSFADALLGRVAPQKFSGKIVLVGASAAGLRDGIVTPYDPSLPGVERHATLIANLLARDFLQRDDRAVVIDALLLLLAGMSIGVLARWGTTVAVTGAVLLIAGLTLFDYVAFIRFGLWLNFLFPAATIVLICALIVGGKYAIEWRRQRFIRDAFSRYLHADLVKELCRTQTPLRLGGEERELTVLFADIRDFTTVAERLSAPELTALMNEFFTAMTGAVLAHRGMLDKYIGDSLMAVFGAPLPDAQHALNACRAALAMRSALAPLHKRWRAEGSPCLEMRIGINTGRMVIGNMGTERRFDYTVMGDEVNVAARLEGANKALGTDILVSASTSKGAGADAVFRPRGEVEVKGRKQPVAVFELLAATGKEGHETLRADGQRAIIRGQQNATSAEHL
jgi:adenylate cyclase